MPERRALDPLRIIVNFLATVNTFDANLDDIGNFKLIVKNTIGKVSFQCYLSFRSFGKRYCCNNHKERITFMFVMSGKMFHRFSLNTTLDGKERNF